MSWALYRLQDKYGLSFGRVQWAYLLQKYDVMPTDEVPAGMYDEIKN